MSPECVVVSYGGSWINDNYVGGERRYVHVPTLGFTYATLLRKIEGIVGADMNMHAYVLHSIVKSLEGESLKMNVMNDDDLKFLMESFQVPKLFVTVSPRSVAPLPHVLYQTMMMDGSFLNLLNAQNVSLLQNQYHIGPHVGFQVNLERDAAVLATLGRLGGSGRGRGVGGSARESTAARLQQQRIGKGSRRQCSQLRGVGSSSNGHGRGVGSRLRGSLAEGEGKSAAVLANPVRKQRRRAGAKEERG